jgi:hypothetical protein
MSTQWKLVFATALFCSASNWSALPSQSSPLEGQYQHVLLLSVDGLHEADLTDPSLTSSLPNVLGFAHSNGVTYSNAFASKPSDSFPGTLAALTGASPKTTGVFYDVAYNYRFTAPISSGGTAASPTGTEVVYDESVDFNSTLLSGGGTPGFNASSINPDNLPQFCNRKSTCEPVFPHNNVKVNTIFNVAKAAGLLTAFSDKHPSYDIANGAPGNGVDELYTPEINASVAIENGVLVDASNCTTTCSSLTKVTKSVPLTETYDDLKVTAILNEIKGLDPLGQSQKGVPAIFGMNFQAVSVAQKELVDVNGNPNGGIPTAGNPSSDLTHALSHTDASIGQIITALQQSNLFSSTLIVIYAKHGQAPRIGQATVLPDTIIPDALNSAGIPVAQATQDDVSLIWLQDPQQTLQAFQLLRSLKNSQSDTGIDRIIPGNYLVDPRVPSLTITVQPGILYGDPSSPKRAEHGGYSDDDTHTALIVGSGGLPPNFGGTTQPAKASNTQIAVTALQALGLNSDALQGAKAEGTTLLPGLGLSSDR